MRRTLVAPLVAVAPLIVVGGACVPSAAELLFACAVDDDCVVGACVDGLCAARADDRPAPVVDDAGAVPCGAACAQDAGAADAGARDAGVVVDAGLVVDAGADDGGAPLDAGVDAGFVDAGPWWDDAWSARLRLVATPSTIDAAATDEVDVPLLVVLDAVDLAALGATNDGRDLRFVDPFALAPLAYEVAVDGAGARAWVRLPLVVADDVVVDVYAGNAAAVDAQDPASVWSAGYLAVWHFDDAILDGGAVVDATAYAHDGVAVGGVASTDGLVGGALAFDGSGRVSFGIPAAFQWAGPVAVEAVLRPAVDMAAQQTYAAIASQWAGTSGAGFIVLVSPPGVGLSTSNGSNQDSVYGGAFPVGSWTSVVAQWAAPSKRMFLDGALLVDQATENPARLAEVGADTELTVGGQPGFAYFTGAIDELRISDTARSPTWVALQHASAVGALWTKGAVETR